MAVVTTTLVLNLNNRIDDLRTDLGGRIDRLDGRMDRLDNRMQQLDERMRTVEVGFAKIDQRLATLERAVIPAAEPAE